MKIWAQLYKYYWPLHYEHYWLKHSHTTGSCVRASDMWNNNILLARLITFYWLNIAHTTVRQSVHPLVFPAIRPSVGPSVGLSVRLVNIRPMSQRVILQCFYAFVCYKNI